MKFLVAHEVGRKQVELLNDISYYSIDGLILDSFMQTDQ